MICNLIFIRFVGKDWVYCILLNFQTSIWGKNEIDIAAEVNMLIMLPRSFDVITKGFSERILGIHI